MEFELKEAQSSIQFDEQTAILMVFEHKVAQIHQNGEFGAFFDRV
jgi:hypothetical protein